MDNYEKDNQKEMIKRIDAGIEGARGERLVK